MIFNVPSNPNHSMILWFSFELGPVQHSPDRVMIWVPCNIIFLPLKNRIKVEIIISHFLFWSRYFYMGTRCHSVFPAVSVTTECIKIIFLIFTNSRVKAMSKKYISFGHFSLIYGIFSDFLPHVYKHAITNKIIITAIQKLFLSRDLRCLGSHSVTEQVSYGMKCIDSPIVQFGHLQIKLFCQRSERAWISGKTRKNTPQHLPHSPSQAAHGTAEQHWVASCLDMWIWLRQATSSQNFWPGGDLAFGCYRNTAPLPCPPATLQTPLHVGSSPAPHTAAGTEQRGKEMGVGMCKWRLGVALDHSTLIYFGLHCYGITGSVENAPSRNRASVPIPWIDS